MYCGYLEKQFDSILGEYKLCTNNAALLGLSKPRLATVQFPHSYIALQYA